jgi:hypothetical protein
MWPKMEGISRSAEAPALVFELLIESLVIFGVARQNAFHNRTKFLKAFPMRMLRMKPVAKQEALASFAPPKESPIMEFGPFVVGNVFEFF